MTLVLGDADDARGFALAGVKTVRCRTRDDVVRALTAARQQARVVAISRSVAQLASAEIEALMSDEAGPITVVLPGAGESV